jgi:hypothetical protein
LIVNPDLTVRRLWVSPDWLARTGQGSLAALPEISAPAAA